MNIDTCKELPFDQLRTLHREIGALIAERRTEALEKLRQEASTLGFTADDLAPPRSKKANGKPKRRYRDPDNPDNTWGGKGPKPAWLTEAIESGRQQEEFLDHATHAQ